MTAIAGSPTLLFSDGAFLEGPVWSSAGRFLVWSDIPNDRLLVRTADGRVATFRAPSRFANGNTRDGHGRLVTCEHGARRVTRTEPDGAISVLADRYEDRRLNSPNDVVTRSDGTVWFTDPDYGLRQNLPGVPREQPHDNVFRCDPSTGALEVVVEDMVKPNGLAFSPDERILYVSDSAITDGPDLPSRIMRFELDEGGTQVRRADVFAEVDGVPDGMRVDTEGNVWASAGPGVNRYAPDGDLLDRIAFPCDVTNLEFGGRGDGVLYVTAGTSLYGVAVRADGAQSR